MARQRPLARAAGFSALPQQRPRVLLVVCPTEDGGHIEHAAELAAAGTRSGVCERAVVLTRPGGRAYLSGWLGELEVAEILAPRRGGPSFIRGVRQLADIARDRATMTRLFRRFSYEYRVSVIYETGRYGIARIPRGGVSVLFVHNAVPHAVSHLSARDRLLEWLQRASARRAGRVVVHGLAQRDLVASWTDREVLSVDLPGDTRSVQSRPVEGMAAPIALCLGEVRPNKGIETAIQAAVLAGVPLTVAGRPEPEWYGEELRSRALGSATVLRLGFLSAEEFAWLLESARVVLLPYRTFAAQSGVLARAMQLSKQVVLSDLPALREQAGTYERVRFFPVDDEQAAAAALEGALAQPHLSGAGDCRVGDRELWCQVVRQVLLPSSASSSAT